MRCITYCPQGAIFSPRRKYSKKYRAIGEDRLQNAERLNS
jgi:Pyruvate/2-oxoacid:ferredoxin oxidoreductase delta subunit